MPSLLRYGAVPFPPVPKIRPSRKAFDKEDMMGLIHQSMGVVARRRLVACHLLTSYRTHADRVVDQAGRSHFTQQSFPMS